MAEFVSVCNLGDVAVGQVRQFKVRGVEIALAHVRADGWYAIGGRCTHLRAPLGRGRLDGYLAGTGTALTCPWHGSQFDVTSGKLLRWVQEPPWMRVLASFVPRFLRRGVPTYEVQVADQQVLVKI